MIEGFTTTEIAAALNVTERAIQLQARAWSGGVRRPKGKGLMYPLESLPEKIRQKMNSIYKEQNGSPEPDRDDRTGNPSDSCPDPSPGYVPALVEHTELVGGQIAPTILPPTNEERISKPQRAPSAIVNPNGGKRNSKINAWVAIIRAWEEYRALRLQEPVVECEYAFAKAYQLNEVDVAADVYETIPKISRATLCRKRVELAKGVTALAGKEYAGRPK
jgi:hypothetical protein